MFQNHPLSPDQLIDLVRQGLSSIKEARTSGVADREYSNRIKQTLVGAATIEGRQFATYSKAATEDYTYDVSWWNDRQQMILAVEIEWYGVKYALEKLFAAECPLKLLVTGSKDLPATRDLLEKSLRRYRRHIAGEHYVWIAADRTKTGGQIRAFECVIEGPGHRPLLAFRSVELSLGTPFASSIRLAA